ncbi:MAG: aldehyde-activating protein [Pseudomonadota bacterium]
MTGSCICGAATVTIEQAPGFINDCNCSLCRRSGAGWGYFSRSQVTAAGETLAVERKDKAVAAVTLHACAACGTTTHFTLSEAFLKDNPDADQVGVNMKLFDASQLEGVEVRFPDGASWSGSGEFGYRRDPITISADSFW